MGNQETDFVVEEATETNQDDIKQLQKHLKRRSNKSKKFVFLLFNPKIYKNFLIIIDKTDIKKGLTNKNQKFKKEKRNEKAKY